MNRTKEIAEAFHVADLDGDGKLNIADAAWVLRGLGYNCPETELVAAFKPHGELITLPEFIKAFQAGVGSVNHTKKLKELLEPFDRDGNGTMSSWEFKQMLLLLGERLSSKEVEELLKIADPKDSGSIDYMRFINILLPAAGSAS